MLLCDFDPRSSNEIYGGWIWIQGQTSCFWKYLAEQLFRDFVFQNIHHHVTPILILMKDCDGNPQMNTKSVFGLLLSFWSHSQESFNRLLLLCKQSTQLFYFSRVFIFELQQLLIETWSYLQDTLIDGIYTLIQIFKTMQIFVISCDISLNGYPVYNSLNDNRYPVSSLFFWAHQDILVTRWEVEHWPILFLE